MAEIPDDVKLDVYRSMLSEIEDLWGSVIIRQLRSSIQSIISIKTYGELLRSNI